MTCRAVCMQPQKVPVAADGHWCLPAHRLLSSGCESSPARMWLVQVVYGAIAALGGACICSWTRVWNNGLKRVVAVLFTGLALMWLGLQ